MKLFFLMLALSVQIGWSQTDSTDTTNSPRAGLKDDDRHYVFSTRSVEITRFNTSVGVALSILPQPLTEYPVPAPMADVRWRLAFPIGLEGYGRFGSNIVTNLIKAGALYSFDMGPFALGLGYSVSYIYGNLTFIDDFNTSQHRWLNQPMLCSTVQFDNISISARFELEYLTSLEQRIADQTVASNANIFTGGSLTLVLEQPFWHKTHVVLGITLSNSNNPYQAWFLYNTFKDSLFLTELFVGFIL